MDAGVIILAGGKSSRMGTNKALLKINDMTNIERILTNISPVFPNPILVTNDTKAYHFLGLKTVSDYFPGKGPLAGIHAGLIASSAEVNVVIACDMPFVSAELAVVLVKNSRDYDAVVPVIGGRQHPLFAVFKKKLAVRIEDHINRNRLSMKDLLNQLNVLYLTEEDLQVGASSSFEKLFYNMNHPYEYEEALQLAMAERQDRGR
ncbi:molybdenum cofactor guanylyltransferase [Bacillus sp. EB600]|uniref:molybdenum cofactor guanylyltransferase n=1 Tax=Bacillus sp. EB600 TaxID=2806345 RepID=UPI00210C12A9|nr:molybdenum cofactor guanylyltransferase [Bacillus sp. EB600]MCQ6280322.1 molybdenum cofactor guanylyltransferase [Bacillus sp. EB600]